MSTELGSIISNASARKTIYLGYAIVVVAAGAAAAWFTAVGEPAPSWLIGATAVLAYIGGALGLTAAANTTATVAETPAPVDEPAETVPDLPGVPGYTAERVDVVAQAPTP